MKIGTWFYYVWMCPTYYHEENDHEHFRLTIALLIDSGACRNHEIVSAFGITRNCACRAVRQLRERGIRSFFEKRRTRNGGTQLTTDKFSRAQTTEFSSCLDVPDGGSLCALPALLANGLLSGLKKLGTVKDIISRFIFFLSWRSCVCAGSKP